MVIPYDPPYNICTVDFYFRGKEGTHLNRRYLTAVTPLPNHVLQVDFLALVLCLSLAACGNSDDVAGEDWRTTGVVVGSGTITGDGESVDVLVTVDPNNAAFYRDQEEQVLFDSVAFPETIEDISSSAFQISFDDQNGDGESDVLVEIGHEDMSNTTMLWLWDPQERYVYQPDYSSFHVPGVAGPEELIVPLYGTLGVSGGEPMAAHP